MSPIRSSIGRSVGKLLNSFRDRDLSLNSSVKTTRVLPFSASGGVTSGGITPGNGYTYHVFLSPGNLVVNGSGTIDFLVVAGGGGGAEYQGGGGGAGGIAYGVSYPVNSGTYPIGVGTGGNGAPDAGTADTSGSKGFDSTIVFGGTTITAKGGGAGSRNNYGYPSSENPKSIGGSSGGAGGGGRVSGADAYPASQPGTNPSPLVTDYGNIGGDQLNINGGTAGGGGGAGGTGSPDRNGGNGQPFPSFAAPLISPQIPAPLQATWISEVGPTGLYGGGGGGGAGPSAGGTGGTGGGGDGGPNSPPSPGGAGTTYTGGGGGGAGSDNGPGGNGGTGIVIVRYITG